MSAVEMLPTTFNPWSTTATEVRPSLFMSVKASASGASELKPWYQYPEHFHWLGFPLLDGDDLLGSNLKIPEDAPV